jgi:hypothetical protein
MTIAATIADDALFVPLTADQIGLANSKLAGL